MLKFFGHLTDKRTEKKKITMPRKAISIVKIKPSPAESFLSLRQKEDATKSMKKYERELEFKNRVIREKEKQIFN